MKRSKLTKDKQLKLIEHFAAGTTARTASVLVKVNKTAASYYFLRLRELIFEYEKEKEEEVFNGEIEADGTARVYFVKLFWRQKKRKKRERSLHIKYQCLVY